MLHADTSQQHSYYSLKTHSTDIVKKRLKVELHHKRLSRLNTKAMLVIKPFL